MIVPNVQITFFTEDDRAFALRGTIRRSDAEMVIDIPLNTISERAYLLRGHSVQGFFAGRDEVTEPAPLDIVARWAELGDIWVGWWIEEGVEYLFSFRLPRNGAPSPRKIRKRRA